MAINRKELLNTVFAGKGSLTYVTGWSEKSEGWNPEWQNRFDQMYGFNPAKAKALLKEAGYGPGALKFKILAFTEPGESEGPQVAEALGIYYKDVGIETEIEVLDWAKVREMFRKKTIQCCIWPNIISWRPSEEWIRTSYWSKSAGHNYENEFIDKTYNALTLAVDPKERQRLARSIGDHLFEEFADIPLFWFANEVVVNPKVVSEWVYPGLAAGRSTHFHLIKADEVAGSKVEERPGPGAFQRWGYGAMSGPRSWRVTEERHGCAGALPSDRGVWGAISGPPII